MAEQSTLALKESMQMKHLKPLPQMTGLALVLILSIACGLLSKPIPSPTPESTTTNIPTPTDVPTLAHTPIPTITPTPTLNATNTPTPIPSAELRVPLDYPTIQAAIDAARSGDVVVVSPGTYTESIHFQGKDITVRSNDPDDPAVVATTIIDGAGSGILVVFQFSDETGGGMLAGFTITNGEIGVYVENSSPTITNNVIMNNRKGMFGGGIMVNGSKSCPSIVGNTISGNKAEFGGGIGTTVGGSAAIADNTITDNVALLGGGVFLSKSATVTGNTFSNNRALQSGGAIFVASGVTLHLSEPDDNTYSGNVPDNVFYE